MDLGLKGKSALVTGGSKGIGLAIAELFAAEGANVAICARNADEVGNVVKSLSAKGVKSWGRAVDVADPDAMKGWIDEAAAELGGIDTIVCNVSALAINDRARQNPSFISRKRPMQSSYNCRARTRSWR